MGGHRPHTPARGKTPGPRKLGSKGRRPVVGIEGAMPLCLGPASADGVFRSAAAVGVDEGGRRGGVEGIEARRLPPRGEDDGPAEAVWRRAFHTIATNKGFSVTFLSIIRRLPGTVE